MPAVFFSKTSTDVMVTSFSHTYQTSFLSHNLHASISTLEYMHSGTLPECISFKSTTVLVQLARDPFNVRLNLASGFRVVALFIGCGLNYLPKAPQFGSTTEHCTA